MFTRKSRKSFRFTCIIGYIFISFEDGLYITFNHFKPNQSALDEDRSNFRGHFAYEGIPRLLSFSLIRGFNDHIIDFGKEATHA